MKWKIVKYAIITIIAFQIVSYFVFSKRFLIDKELSETELNIGLGGFDSVLVNHNFKLTIDQKDKLNYIFTGKEIEYYHFEQGQDLENVLFFDEKLSFTINISRFFFPIATVSIIESSHGYAYWNEYLYVWLFIKWIKIKEIGWGQA